MIGEVILLGLVRSRWTSDVQHRLMLVAEFLQHRMLEMNRLTDVYTKRHILGCGLCGGGGTRSACLNTGGRTRRPATTNTPTSTEG